MHLGEYKCLHSCCRIYSHGCKYLLEARTIRLESLPAILPQTDSSLGNSQEDREGKQSGSHDIAIVFEANCAAAPDPLRCCIFS